MGILSWIILGLVAGVIAKLLIPGKDPGGCIITIIIGILGAMLGGWIGSIFNFGTVQQFDIKGVLIAVLGSVILLLLYRVITKKKE